MSMSGDSMALDKRHADVWPAIAPGRCVVLPSLLLCDFGNLEAEVRRLEAAGMAALHLDVMDGHFVPNLSYGVPLVRAFRQLTDLPLDVHLMIDNPEQYVDDFRKAGADSMTVHVEATADPASLLQQIRSVGAAAGLALNPPTPLDDIEPYLDLCDVVLVMSVMPGFGGQEFDAAALEKLRALADVPQRSFRLQVDGGINERTIGPAAAAGAEVFVVGSAIFRHANYTAQHDRLQALASAACKEHGNRHSQI
jgi:ribulose-phosphate 3-epimerase